MSEPTFLRRDGHTLHFSDGTSYEMGGGLVIEDAGSHVWLSYPPNPRAFPGLLGIHQGRRKSLVMERLAMIIARLNLIRA